MSDAAKPPATEEPSHPPKARAGLKPRPTYAVGPQPCPTDAPAEGPQPCLTHAASEPVVCERCGSARVYRMHAVWRCADCGYKTDCCGW